MFQDYTPKLLDNLYHAIKYKNDIKVMELLDKYKYNNHFMSFAQVYLALHRTPRLHNLMYWRTTLSKIKPEYHENNIHPSYLSIMGDQNMRWTYSPLGVACELYIFQHPVELNPIKRHVQIDDMVCKYHRIYSHDGVNYKFCTPPIILKWLNITWAEEQSFVGKTFEQSKNILDKMILLSD